MTRERNPTSLTRRALIGATAGAAAGATMLPNWAPANEAEETEFRPRRRGALPERPNVLVILADDLGWAHVSAYGAPDITTTNIDKLALSDEFFGNFSGGCDYFSKVDNYGNYDLYEGEVSVRDLRYYTDIITERTVDFLSQAHTRPWLANVNFTTPHWPWEGPNDQAVSEELTARLLAGETGAPSALWHLDGGNREIFNGMVTSLDAAVGKILRALERTGQRRNTVILFTSDNGGERFSYLWPLFGAKGDTRDGGIRVPTILSWPAALPSRKVSHVPVITMDFTATFLELAGARPHPDYPLDGESLVGHLLRGQPAPGHDLFWRMRDTHALRRGDLKYYVDAQGHPYLFDLSQDQREWANLARKRPTDLAALKTAWEAINATLLPYPPG